VKPDPLGTALQHWSAPSLAGVVQLGSILVHWSPGSLHPITHVLFTHAPLWQKSPTPHGIGPTAAVAGVVICRAAAQEVSKSETHLDPWQVFEGGTESLTSIGTLYPEARLTS
jgi:hypothetical protein